MRALIPATTPRGWPGYCPTCPCSWSAGSAPTGSCGFPSRRQPGTLGRARKHGTEFACNDPATWPAPHHVTTTQTTRCGTATATAWDRLHPRLTRRTCWIDHDGDLPIIKAP
ncbi:hypothetical protein Xph01_06700 [Micromonospora phaseoli]|nr:hypothetical protein Xph01_06700 [Micromonospora phaseoli]